MRKLKHAEIPRIRPVALSGIERHPIAVVIENVRSAHNVGSILRTCDAALVDHVFVTGYTPAPDHPKVKKTALGAEEFLSWETAPNALDVVHALQARGTTVAVLEITDRPTRIEDLVADQFPLALVVGNEVTGVTDEVIAEADLALEIPQYGSKQSLNVAVAFGIAAMGVVERVRSIRPTLP